MPRTSSEDQMFAESLSEVTIKKECKREDQFQSYHQNQREEFKREDDDKIFKRIDNSKKKSRTKKNKKGETDTKNISVKSSFNTFDALQKRNVIHNPQSEVLKNCHLCDKAVFKMEEVKAENNNYHKNCFRCNECKKQLKVDSYQSHQGVLYCSVHFKQLFIPKSVEENQIAQPSKPELIIRESQPTELPPDVIRASDKPDLGLDELQQLNVRSRFQVFEYGKTNSNNNVQKYEESNSKNYVKCGTIIMSKVAKLQELSSSSNKQRNLNSSSENDCEIDSESDNNSANLYQKEKFEQKRESPVGIGEAMNDILCLFEKGHGIRKEERREERKQEIQNIRSRLFLGKQARIKEMYQQAVAESENATDRKPNIEIEVDSKSLRNRFENGEIFRENQPANENHDISRKTTIENEADVFESAISKTSRSIFMELDANIVTAKNQIIMPILPNNRVQHKDKSDRNNGTQLKSNLGTDVVKCSEAVEDIKIQTSEISEKFKFFEKYCPAEKQKSIFRMTPPREGMVKMPTLEESESENENIEDFSPDKIIIPHSRTTSMMLKKFKELEKNPSICENKTPKPLKCFTPPPDGNRRLSNERESDEFASNDDEEEDETSFEEGDDEKNSSHLPRDDESLREAQNAARTKQLRIKFEKWEANEIKHEQCDEINQSKIPISDEYSLESTQFIRERFEKMKSNGETSQTARPRYQVNRFV